MKKPPPRPRRKTPTRSRCWRRLVVKSYSPVPANRQRELPGTVTNPAAHAAGSPSSVSLHEVEDLLRGGVVGPAHAEEDGVVVALVEADHLDVVLRLPHRLAE